MPSTGIKIIKEKKVRDYTFIDEGLSLRESENKEYGAKKDRPEHDYRLRDTSKINKLKHKSKVTGGRSMQGHSPVYE
jgi:hypothetical protein